MTANIQAYLENLQHYRLKKELRCWIIEKRFQR